MTRSEKFRDVYGYQWAVSEKKERFIKDIIEKYTGREVEFFGLGAGSQERLSGEAKDYGHYVGDPDLHIKGSPYFIEVTGPNVFFCPSESSLWVRPDKVRCAYHALRKRGHTTFLVHVLPKSSVRKHLNKLDLDFLPRNKEKPLTEKARCSLGKILNRSGKKKVQKDMMKMAISLYNRGELFDPDKPKSFDNDVIVVIPFDQDFFDNCKEFKVVRYAKKGIQEEFLEIDRDSPYVKSLSDFFSMLRDENGDKK